MKYERIPKPLPLRGVVYYLEFPTREARLRCGDRNEGHSGCVFARFNLALVKLGPHTWGYEGLGRTERYPNAPVARMIADLGFLGNRCKRILQCEAKKIHPALFDMLREIEREMRIDEHYTI